MAVYTKISKKFLLTVLENYSIGLLINYSEIKEGIENTNYLLITSKGKYILTIFENRVDNNEIPFFIELMNHLSKKKFNCPIPQKDKNNQYIQKKNEKYFIIVSFLEGVWKKKITSCDCHVIGKLIGNLHNKTIDFDYFRENSMSILGWEYLLKELKKKNLKDQIEIFNKNLLTEIDESFNKCKNHWPKNLPKGLIHGDIFPDNVFFLSNKISGVIDFYFACNDILMYELAIALNAWCFDDDNNFNLKKAEMLIQGYNSEKIITKIEFNSLPLLAEGAALRFLLTRLYDWFYTPSEAFINKKDPMEYFNKLKFFKYEFKLNLLELECNQIGY